MSTLKTKKSEARKQTDKVVFDYIHGKISVSQARKLLNEIEGRRLVKIYDRDRGTLKTI